MPSIVVDQGSSNRSAKVKRHAVKARTGRSTLPVGLAGTALAGSSKMTRSPLPAFPTSRREGWQLHGFLTLEETAEMQRQKLIESGELRKASELRKAGELKPKAESEGKGNGGNREGYSQEELHGSPSASERSSYGGKKRKDVLVRDPNKPKDPRRVEQGKRLAEARKRKQQEKAELFKANGEQVA